MTLAALLVPFIVQCVTMVASSHFMSTTHYGISAVVQQMTSLPKSFLLFGVSAALVCWLAQKHDNNGQSERRFGRARVSWMLIFLAAGILLGFAMLSNGVALLYGSAYASY